MVCHSYSCDLPLGVPAANEKILLVIVKWSIFLNGGLPVVISGNCIVCDHSDFQNLWDGSVEGYHTIPLNDCLCRVGHLGVLQTVSNMASVGSLEQLKWGLNLHGSLCTFLRNDIIVPSQYLGLNRLA